MPQTPHDLIRMFHKAVDEQIDEIANRFYDGPTNAENNIMAIALLAEIRSVLLRVLNQTGKQTNETP